jgi:hypothetical protein
MSEKIEKVGKGSCGQDVSEGAYMVNPSGNVVLVPATGVPSKPGFRLATASEVKSGKPEGKAGPKG